MDADFWRNRWRSGETGFHQAEIQDLLVSHWPALKLPPGSTVLVPLCGKSLDMVWLAAWGHKVVGVELSELAVDAFFAARNLAPETEHRGDLVVKRAGPFEIWCGDIFALPREAIAPIAAVYDRAALIALPPEMQPRYAAKLAELAGTAAPILLISLEYDESAMSGPPFSVGLAQIAALFGDAYRISIRECRDGLERSENLRKRGLKSLIETLYLIEPKS